MNFGKLRAKSIYMWPGKICANPVNFGYDNIGFFPDAFSLRPT